LLSTQEIVTTTVTERARDRERPRSAGATGVSDSTADEVEVAARRVCDKIAP
jgi:hypothetical protein